MQSRTQGWIVARALLLAIAGIAVLASGAQANVTLPGLNGKIAFASDRDAPPRPEGDPQNFGFCEDAVRGDDDECGFDIFTIDGSGLGTPVNLTKDQPGEDNAKDDKPSWSPDGTQIAFESRRDCDEEDSNSCESNIFVMNADGSNVRKLTSGSDSDTHPTWSPDGSTIAFERFDLINDGPDRLFTVPAAGGAEPTPVDTGLADDDGNNADLLPAWSPDGRQIAFTRISLSEGDSKAGLSELAAGARSGDLSALGEEEGLITIHTHLVTLGSGEATPVGTPDECSIEELTDEEDVCQFDLNPAWSPSGQRIAFHRLTLSGLEILSLPGGEQGPATEGPVFVDDVDIIDTDLGGNESPPLADEGPCFSGIQVSSTGNDHVPCVDDFKPAYSPDSTRIAFHSDRGETECFFNTQGQTGPLERIFNFGGCRPQLYLMNSDGSDVSDPIAPATIRNEGEEQATDRNADWQRVIPPPPAVAETPTAQARRDTRRPRVSVAGVRGCSASTRLRIPVRINERGGIRSVRVSLDGRRILSTRRARFTLTINARRLRSGRHRLRIVATDAAGNRTTVNRSFVRCARRVRRAPVFTG